MKKLLLFLLIAPLIASAQNFWTETATLNSYYAIDISIVDESTVWINTTDLDPTGHSTSIWGLSTDGGLTWSFNYFPNELPRYASSYTFCAQYFGLSEQTAYSSFLPTSHLYQNKIMVTHDSGATWTQIHPELFADANSWLGGIHFFDANHGVAFGDAIDGYFEIYTTLNAAATWTRTLSAAIPSPLADEHCLPGHFETAGGIIRFMTNKGRMFHSADQGVTWTVSQTPINPNFPSHYGLDYSSHRYFSFKDQNEGMLVTTENLLYRTTDGGNTWTPQATTGNLTNRAVTYVPQTANTYYNTGKLNPDDGPWASGYSTNNGNSWTAMTDNPEFFPILTEFYSPDVGYAS